MYLKKKVGHGHTFQCPLSPFKNTQHKFSFAVTSLQLHGSLSKTSLKRKIIVNSKQFFSCLQGWKLA